MSIQVSAMGQKKQKVPFTAKMTVGDAIKAAGFSPSEDATITLNGEMATAATIIEKDGSKVVITPKVKNG